MRIRITKECGEQLQGSAVGKRHFALICSLLAEAKPGGLILLDFKDVAVVTGSWISAALIPLYRKVVEPESDLFPIICHADSAWLDDLALLAKWSHQCFLVASKCEATVRHAKLVGVLDPGQRTTLQAVLSSRSATGAGLERQMASEKIGATAWNNRLKDLHNKRLLRRERQGREQVYSPVVEAIDIDG